VLVTKRRSWTPTGWDSTVQSSLECRSQPAVTVVTDAEGMQYRPRLCSSGFSMITACSARSHQREHSLIARLNAETAFFAVSASGSHTTNPVKRSVPTIRRSWSASLFSSFQGRSIAHPP
jgi:hypothetical protein